ncbi:tegument protein UL7 [Bovine alphaherpesvirus 2]|uniref:Tegument protein UL7 n=1 Tax=Bovine alphaherpesvirus 2 TaxID=10295 RepID=A0ABX6WQG0_9ALPH|nr:tegument protein UL7 [Bovine alphaherpesvirus 2]QPO25140.1 tegument protein UL7 [Bovine alphaherpesvirus 2]
MASAPPENTGCETHHEDEEPAMASLKRAIAGRRDVVAVAEMIGEQTLLRMACEIHEIAARVPRFSTTNVRRVVISTSHTMRVVLDGDPSDADVSSEVYFAACRDQRAYRGFAFAVITAAEDRVGGFSVPPVSLQYRFSLFHPTELVDFELSCLLVYLENCPRDHATPSAFVKISSWLGRVGRETSPLNRMRCLLLRSCHWMLNTLMFMCHLMPFSERFVLPHWCMSRYLLAGNPPPLVVAMFSAPPVSKFSLPNAPFRVDCVAYRADGVLSAAWRADAFRHALVYWWHGESRRKPSPPLFQSIC